MRVVIDSNALRTEELKGWLAASKSHSAVITDYTWMEIYKGNERVALLESLDILKDFPDQVLLLKGTKQISAISGGGPGYANAMIQSKSKAKFHETVRGLIGVERSEFFSMAAIQDHGKVAKGHFKKMDGTREDLLQFLSATDAVFGKGASSEIRHRATLSEEFIERFFLVVNSMHERFLKKHPSGPSPVEGKNRVNHFAWRYALAANLLTKEYVKNGSNLPNNNKIINDMTDMVIAIYGTYFNGIMTSDSGLLNMYLELEVILRRVGARVPTHYIQHPDTMALFGYGDNDTL